MSLDLREVRLTSKIGCYALTLESQILLEADQTAHPRVVAELWADVTVHHPRGSPVALGRATSPEPAFYEAPVGEVPQQTLGDPRVRLSSLSLDVSLRQMDQIEEIRDGRDLVLGLSPGGLTHLGGEVYRLYPNNHQLTFTVPQSDWARLIQGASYANVLTMELRMPDDQSSGDIGQAVVALKHAQAAYLRGDYEEAVADCRQGFVALTRSGDDRFDLKKWPPSASKEERFWRVQRALLSVTHAAHHPEDRAGNGLQEGEESELPAGAEWARADAHSVIVMLTALISQRVRRD